MHELLLVYKSREDHCNTPHKHEEDGENFGQLLTYQFEVNRKENINAARKIAGGYRCCLGSVEAAVGEFCCCSCELQV